MQELHLNEGAVCQGSMSDIYESESVHDKSLSQLSTTPIFVSSPIPQLDGHTSLESSQEFPSIITRQTMFNARSENSENVHIKSAPYTRNKSKQIQGLGKNASAPDFTIDVIDENNASIHCSTGFYEAVQSS